MVKTINFTRWRLPMAVLSIILIIIGGIGIIWRGGVNLSIDLSGGISQQFQIASPALIISHSKESLIPELTPPDPLLGRSGFLSIEWLQEGIVERRIFDFSSFPTISSLAEGIRNVEEITVDIKAPENTSSDSLQPPGFKGLSNNVTLTFVDQNSLGDAPIEAVRKSLVPLGKFSLQIVGRPELQTYIVRTELKETSEGVIDNQLAKENEIFDLLSSTFGKDRVTVQQSDFVGPSFSRILGNQAVWLIVVAFTLIFVYILFRFRLAFAVGALIALVHDIVIMLCVLGVFQFEISTATIAAVLTIVGYSLNDTIVIYDRVRENEILLRDSNFETIINSSITQSLSRTVITSVTTLLAVSAIYVFGTSSIKTFALSLIIGVIVGTYSSVFVASPVLLFIREFNRKKTLRLNKRLVSTDVSTPTEKQTSDSKKNSKEAVKNNDSEGATIPSPSVRVIRKQPRRKKRNRR